MEMHLVHFKSDYENLTAAVQMKDGIAVLGVLFVISENDNPALAPLISQITDKEVGRVTSRPSGNSYFRSKTIKLS